MSHLILMNHFALSGATGREHTWAKAGSTPGWVASPLQGPSASHPNKLSHRRRKMYHDP